MISRVKRFRTGQDAQSPGGMLGLLVHPVGESVDFPIVCPQECAHHHGAILACGITLSTIAEDVLHVERRVQLSHPTAVGIAHFADARTAVFAVAFAIAGLNHRAEESPIRQRNDTGERGLLPVASDVGSPERLAANQFYAAGGRDVPKFKRGTVVALPVGRDLSAHARDKSGVVQVLVVGETAAYNKFSQLVEREVRIQSQSITDAGIALLITETYGRLSVRQPGVVFVRHLQDVVFDVEGFPFDVVGMDDVFRTVGLRIDSQHPMAAGVLQKVGRGHFVRAARCQEACTEEEQCGGGK